MIETAERDTEITEHEQRALGRYVSPILPLFAYLSNLLTGTLNGAFGQVLPPEHAMDFSIKFSLLLPHPQPFWSGILKERGPDGYFLGLGDRRTLVMRGLANEAEYRMCPHRMS